MKTFAIKEKRSASAIRRSQPSRFGYRGPEVKAQRAEIRRILRCTGAQAKLTIGSQNDKYEQEAERVAGQVMAMPDPKLRRQPENEEEEETLQTKLLADQITPLVQRQEEPPDEEEEEPLQVKAIPGQMPGIQRMCPEYEGGQSLQRQPEEEEELQAKEQTGRIPRVVPNVAANIQSLKGGGRPLADSTRSFFEPRIGQDFSQVQIHTDAKATSTAKAVNARAFTLGHDIVFGAGQHQPQTREGKRLLAHELVHVRQQNGGSDVRERRALLPIATIQQTAGRPSGTVQRQAATLEDRPRLSSPKLARLLGHTDLSGFEHNRSELRKVHRDELAGYSRTILNLIRDYPTGVVTITGHCDASGGPERNDPLGLARAEAAKAFLVTEGVDAERVVTFTRGENDLRVQTRRKEPRNRRVEIRFIPTPMSLGMRQPEKPKTEPGVPDLSLPPDYVVPPSPPPPITQLPPCPFLGPETGKRPTVKLSYGFPLTLEIIVNPQAPVPKEAKLGELFTKRGLRLTDAELKALLEGRSDGVGQLETIIRNTAPSLGPGCARALAEKIADGLMGESLGGQLGRERPGIEERLAEQEERMRELTGAPDRGPDIQGGVKLIIHF